MTHTLENYRDDFPVLQQSMNGKPLAFLDSAASAQKPSFVIEKMNEILTSRYSNIHRGLYKISQDLTADYEVVRSKVSGFLGTQNEREIVFTRNSTESINLVAQSYGRTFLKKGDEVLISAMEHHANIVPWQILKEQIGIELKIIPVLDDYTLDLEAAEKLINPQTRIVSIVHKSNACGTVNDVIKIRDIARAKAPNVKVLIDGSQSVVHSAIDVKELDCDFFVFTGHKLYGPSGIGVLWGREELLNEMPPYQGGGDMIERVTFEKSTYREAPYKFEAGTPAITEVIGLGAAIDYVSKVGFKAIEAHEKALSHYTIERLKEVEGLTLHAHEGVTSVFPFTMEGTHPSDIGMILDQCGVAVRAGHHCCMPLLQRFDLDATVRASLGLYSNKGDIDQLIEGLQKVKSLFG